MLIIVRVVCTRKPNGFGPEREGTGRGRQRGVLDASLYWFCGATAETFSNISVAHSHYLSSGFSGAVPRISPSCIIYRIRKNNNNKNIHSDRVRVPVSLLNTRSHVPDRSFYTTTLLRSVFMNLSTVGTATACNIIELSRASSHVLFSYTFTVSRVTSNYEYEYTCLWFSLRLNAISFRHSCVSNCFSFYNLLKILHAKKNKRVGND